MYTKVLSFIDKYNIDRRFVKFLFVGGINTLFSYCVYSLVWFSSHNLILSTLLQYIIGILFNFKTTGSIVFKNKNNGLIFKFVGVYIIAYFFNLASLKILYLLHCNMYVAFWIVVFPVAMLSFTLMKKFVFKD